jgi:hypothetical protein
MKYEHGRILDFTFCIMFMKEDDHSLSIELCCILKQTKMIIRMNRPGCECDYVFVVVVFNVLKFAFYNCYSLICDMIILMRDLFEGLY